MILYFPVVIFWIIREVRTVLFWIHLWQLKEYQRYRIADHFRTKKGKSLILNKNNLAKAALLLVYVLLLRLPCLKTSLGEINSAFCLNLYVLTAFFSMVTASIFYLAEALFAVRRIYQKQLKAPVITTKTVVLTAASVFAVAGLTLVMLSAESAYSVYFVFVLPIVLIVIDFLTPAIVSIIVLVFEPLAVYQRNKIINKAKNKRRNFPNLLAVGITGSYGKTSTKEYLATILSKKFSVLKTKEHQNSEIGVSQSILNDLTPENEIFIAEMGAYRKGGIKLLADMITPKIGIVSGVNEQHLALFGSMENLLSAEGGKELVDSLPEAGLAIFNGNNKYCLDLYKATDRIRKSLCKTDNSENPDIWTENIVVGKDYIAFRVVTKEMESTDIKANVLGGHNAQNILLAIAAARELGLSLEEIAEGAKNIKLEQGPIKIIPGINGLNIIDSTYSANPSGVVADLEYLKVWGGKKILVMPCLIELGSASEENHKEIGKKIAEICDLAIITSEEMIDEIRQGATERGMKRGNIVFLDDPKKIIEKIANFCQTGDVILLESRVPRELIRLLATNV